MLSATKHFILDESALEEVEWAIVGGVIVAVGALIFVAIGQDASRGLTALGAVTGDIR